jgi:3-phosphoshikimate 1-carboxyvinyltransferase
MKRFIVPAPQPYAAAEYPVEPDATAASYFFAAAALTGGRTTVEGLGSGSCQGDIGFVRVLERMGCTVEQGPAYTTVAGPANGRLQGLEVDLSDMPDTAQTLAVLAAFSDGPTTIRGLGTLNLKETDRLLAISTELGRMGVETEVSETTITIRPGRPPTAATLQTYGDHRMAMSFALAGLRVDGMALRSPECVNKTFPEFFEVWGKFSGTDWEKC